MTKLTIKQDTKTKTIRTSKALTIAEVIEIIKNNLTCVSIQK